MNLPDNPDEYEDGGVDVERRDVLKSMGALGFALNGVDSASLDGVTQSEDDPGWLVVNSSSAAQPRPRQLGLKSYDDPDYVGHMVASNHTLDYKGAQWVEFGDPKDSIGGCWKHTFVLAGSTAAIEAKKIRRNSPSRLYPDATAYDSTQFVLRTDDDGLAISEHRDRDLTGFLSTIGIENLMRGDIKVDGEKWNVKELLREVVASDDSWIKGHLLQTADDPTEAANKEDAISDAAIGAVATVAGLFPAAALSRWGLASLVHLIAPLLPELLSDTEYQPTEVLYSDGISATWDSHTNASGGGGFVTFDVFVSPEVENASFTVESNHSVKVGDMVYEENKEQLQSNFDFNPKPSWIVEVSGNGTPEELDQTDDIHNARVRASNVPPNQWTRNGRDPPVAVIDVEQSPPTTETGINLDGSNSFSLDGSIETYEWQLEPSPVDGKPQPVPSNSDGVITQTGESVNFNVAPGDYTVRLTVTDTDGETRTTSKLVPVTDAPNVSLSASTTTPEFGDEVQFTASASDPANEPLSYYWSVVETSDSSGGTNSGSGGSERWPYLNGDSDTERTLDAADPGATVDVSVTVQDPIGATASSTVTVTVAELSRGKGGNGGPSTDGNDGPSTNGGPKNGGGPGKGNGPNQGGNSTKGGSDFGGGDQQFTLSDAQDDSLFAWLLDGNSEGDDSFAPF